MYMGIYPVVIVMRSMLIEVFHFILFSFFKRQKFIFVPILIINSQQKEKKQKNLYKKTTKFSEKHKKPQNFFFPQMSFPFL